MDPRLVTPYLIAALVVWGVYRRMRRSFGRQRVREGLMWLRVGLFTLIAALAAVSVARDVDVLGALLAGIACGALLGYIGLKYTKFEVVPGGRFYTPHAYIGLVVTALFLGRLVYRLLYLSHGAYALGDANQNLAVAYQRSPLTLGIFAALVGYYVLFYGGILMKTRTPALPVSAGPTE